MDLFDTAPPAPLADRMRPATLEEFVGQRHLLSPKKPLEHAIASGSLHSMVFWGPPGTGKTTLARLIARQTHAQFMTLSAVTAGIKEIRAAVAQAKTARAEGRPAILFVDEVHRFNKAQQDAFLPHVEDGTVTLIGATTENPSFELNSALLSRVRTYVLEALTPDDLRTVMERALADSTRGLGGRGLTVSAEALASFAEAADGDARRALTFLEIASDLARAGEGAWVVDEPIAREVTAGGLRRFDKRGDVFHDQISALHKCVRGSAPDAALYWLARMLDGGCDPLYIARRVVRMACEDVGNADPRGLSLALDAWDTYERLGSPEGELAIAQAVVYLACTAKSNAVYVALDAAMADARRFGSREVPLHLRNTPTRLMRELGHGGGYRYAHDEPDAYAAGQRYFPDGMPERRYYEPVDRGLEARIRERLMELRRREHRADDRMDGSVP